MSNGKLVRLVPAIAITLLSVLLLSTFLAPTIAYVPNNPVEPPWHGMAFVGTRPDPIGVTQSLLIQSWISPRPRHNYDVYYDYEYTFTSPSGVKEYYTFKITEHPGTIWFERIFPEVGEWTLEFNWDGVDSPGIDHPPEGWTGLDMGTTEFNWQDDHEDWFAAYDAGTPGYEPWASGDHEPITQTVTFTVQQDPIPSWPAAPLPTDGWDWPVWNENREWSNLIGYWPMSNYNASKGCYNPYTESVKSPHVMWYLEPRTGLGGLMGGVYGGSEYVDGSSFNVDAAAFGKVYDDGGGQIYCFDIRTGEMDWSAPGSFSYLTIADGSPVLLEVTNSELIKYDGWTGEEIDSSPIPRLATRAFIDPYVTGLQVLEGGDHTRWIKFDTTSNTNNFASRIIHNVTFYNRNTGEGIYASEYELERGGDPNVVWIGDYNVMTYLTYPLYGESGAFDMWTGDLLWHRHIEDFESRNSIGGGYDLVFLTEWPQKWNAFDTRTGARVWTGAESTYPWGNFWAYQVGVGYGMMYGINYDGHIYAYDIFGDYTGTPGAFVWNYSVGNSDPYSMETPYTYHEADGTQHGTWAVYSGPVLGGEVIYAATSEWGTPHPYYRGQRMVAANAITGENVWQLGGSWDPSILAEGYLFAYNRYQARQYCFGRGPTMTEVSTDIDRIAKGESVWIMGRVTDQTPVLKDTPAVSKDSMQEWMEYMFFQQPRPMDTVGVDVTLYAVKSDGSLITIGDVTCDGQGYFSYKWTPTDEDLYQVTASFNGDESYYSSWDLTNLSVGPEITVEPTENGNGDGGVEAPDNTVLLYGIGAGVVIAIVIGLVAIYMIRKRE